jgi:hypothetical protein
MVMGGVERQVKQGILGTQGPHRDTGEHTHLAACPQFLEAHGPERTSGGHAGRVDQPGVQINAVGPAGIQEVFFPAKVIPVPIGVEDPGQSLPVLCRHQ